MSQTLPHHPAKIAFSRAIPFLTASLLLCHSLPALWQGPLMIFRRAPDDKSGPSTKALEAAFGRLPALPPPGAVVASSPSPESSPSSSSETPSSVAPLIPAEPNRLETADDLSKLFEKKPDTGVSSGSSASVVLPSNAPEVPITPGN